MEYNKNKAKGYTLGHDTPLNLHMKKVKELTSNVSLAILFTNLSLYQHIINQLLTIINFNITMLSS